MVGKGASALVGIALGAIALSACVLVTSFDGMTDRANVVAEPDARIVDGDAPGVPVDGATPVPVPPPGPLEAGVDGDTPLPPRAASHACEGSVCDADELCCERQSLANICRARSEGCSGSFGECDDFRDCAHIEDGACCRSGGSNRCTAANECGGVLVCSDVADPEQCPSGTACLPDPAGLNGDSMYCD